MTYQLKCPNCSQHLYFSGVNEKKGFLESLCRNCQYKYALQEIEVENFVSNVETKPENAFTKNTSLSRVYNLRLKQADGTLKSLAFSTPGQSEKISALTGDTILMLYTMRGTVLQDLGWLKNLTTGKSHLLLNSGAKARSIGFATSVLTLFSSTILVSFLHSPINKVVWLAAIPSSIGVGLYFAKHSSLKVSDRAELRQLTSKQQILAQKYELEQRITGFNKELKESQNLMQCLTGLQSKMMSVGEDLYACQLVTVTKGINIIQEQISFSQDVINGYSQLIKIIEIEFETSQLVEQLPEDISEKILRRLEELMVIQTKKEELSLLFDPQQIMPQLYFK